MKIIHTADLHLDSSMKTNLDSVKAKERKNELTLNFGRLVKFANENEVSAILIAGDLFDTKSVSKTVAKAVYNNIISNPDISFYYLKGNHDKDSFAHFILDSGDIPKNLYMFGNGWTKYTLPSNEDGRSVSLYEGGCISANMTWAKLLQNGLCKTNTTPQHQ